VLAWLGLMLEVLLAVAEVLWLGLAVRLPVLLLLALALAL
jgi:hypothetical protein